MDGWIDGWVERKAQYSPVKISPKVFKNDFVGRDAKHVHIMHSFQYYKHSRSFSPLGYLYLINIANIES